MRRKLNKYIILFPMLGITIYSAAMDDMKSAVDDMQKSLFAEGEGNLLADTMSSNQEIPSPQLNKDDGSEQEQTDVQLSVDFDLPSYRENPLYALIAASFPLIAGSKDRQPYQRERVKRVVTSERGLEYLENIDEEHRHIILYRAIYWEDKELVQMLIVAGTNVNKKFTNGTSPLFHAISRGSSEVVKILIAEGANTDDLDENGYNGLHVAVLEGSESVVEALIASGVNLEKKSANGDTALHLAACAGHIKIVKMLFVAGANPCCEDNRLTPLVLAITSGNQRLCLVLASAESKRNHGVHSGMIEMFAAVGSNNKKFVNSYIAAKLSLNFVDSDNCTLLHLAACKGFTEIAQILVRARIQLNKIDKKGKTPLIQAIQNGHHETAELLIAAGADLNIGDISGFSALHHAAANGMEKISVALVKKGVNPNMPTKAGKTPLYIAVMAKKMASVRVLIECGASLTKLDEYNNTLLHVLAMVSDTMPKDLLRLVWKYTNMQNTLGLTPLHFAALAGYTGMVSLLLTLHANVRSESVINQTALHFAAQGGHLEVVRLLIASGAEIDKVFEARRSFPIKPPFLATSARPYVLEYKTALSEAVENGKGEVTEFLLEAGAKQRESFLRKFDDPRAMKELNESLLDLLISENHDKTRCNCQRILNFLLQKGLKLSTIKQSLYQNIRKKQTPSRLDSVVMFQLIGRGLYKK